LHEGYYSHPLPSGIHASHSKGGTDFWQLALAFGTGRLVAEPEFEGSLGERTLAKN
jgi:hypothetical protein